MSFFVGTRKRAAISLAIVTVLLVLLLALSSVMAMFAPMAFDSPGSVNDANAWMAFYGILGIPLSTLLAIVLSWIAFFFRRYGLALLLTLLPVVYLAFAIFIL